MSRKDVWEKNTLFSFYTQTQSHQSEITTHGVAQLYEFTEPHLVSLGSLGIALRPLISR